MAAPATQSARASATQARLAAQSMPKGALWANEARADALSRFDAMGLAQPRDEYWRYTPPHDLNRADALPAALFDTGDAAEVFAGVDRLKIVFVDGVFDPSLSDDLTLAGVEILPLDQAMGKDIHWAREVFGKLEAAGQSPVPRPYAAFNTAFATQGMVIRATARAAKPVSLIYLHRSDVSDALIHHVIRVESGAELTLLEQGPAAARLTAVTEIDVAEGGVFHHIRAQGRDHARRAITHCFARLGAGAHYKSFSLTCNGVLTRNEHVIDIAGEGARAHVAGAALGDGAKADFHHDDTVFITHGAEGCESRQVFKKVLRNGAVGVFQGKILVHPQAQKTDGYQISQSLLLDEDSVFLAKPELEIYADDVKCSHGSTTGAIDEEGLFYLRARGVPADIATDLLVIAFLAEALEEIADPDLRDQIQTQLEAWLARRRG